MPGDELQSSKLDSTTPVESSLLDCVSGAQNPWRLRSFRAMAART